LDIKIDGNDEKIEFLMEKLCDKAYRISFQEDKTDMESFQMNEKNSILETFSDFFCEVITLLGRLCKGRNLKAVRKVP